MQGMSRTPFGEPGALRGVGSACRPLVFLLRCPIL